MENIRENLRRVLSQLGVFWNSLNAVKKAAVFGGIAAVIIGAVVVVVSNSTETYDYLFVNLSSEDQAAITDYLKKNNISNFIVDSK